MTQFFAKDWSGAPFIFFGAAPTGAQATPEGSEGEGGRGRMERAGEGAA